MRLTSSFIGGGCTVALEHGPRPPAGDPHEVGLVAALGEPGVGEGVAELMRVEAGDAGLLAAPVEHVAKPVVGPWASLAEPEPFLGRVLVEGAHAEVPVDRLGSLATEGTTRCRPPLPSTWITSYSKLTSETRRLSSSERRAPVSSRSMMMAMSRRETR